MLMKVAIMGAGALGCFIGGRLVGAGCEVTFIARGAQFDALSRKGLRIESPVQNANLRDLKVVRAPEECGPVDVVVFVVKLYDTHSSASLLAPLLRPETAVVSFQNGVEGWSVIGDVVGADHVVGGIAYIPVDLTQPGQVRHKSSVAKLHFGEFNGVLSNRCRDFAEMLTESGIEAQVFDDIERDRIERKIWEKFVFISALSGITALTRLPLGPILDDPHCASLYEAALRETQTVAERKVTGFPADCADRQLAFSKTLVGTISGSMADDLASGKRLELDYLSGAVVRFGKELDVPTPVHAVIQASLHPFINGSPRGSASKP